MEYYSVVISVDRYHRRRALGRVALGLSYIIYSTAQPKAAKTAAGITVTLRTAILAEDRSVNKPYLSVAL